MNKKISGWSLHDLEKSRELQEYLDSLVKKRLWFYPYYDEVSALKRSLKDFFDNPPLENATFVTEHFVINFKVR